MSNRKKVWVSPDGDGGWFAKTEGARRAAGNYAKEGNKILDTHLGSGSIAIACYDMGFDLTGYEIDKEYFDAAVKRLDNHKKQLTFI